MLILALVVVAAQVRSFGSGPLSVGGFAMIRVSTRLPGRRPVESLISHRIEEVSTVEMRNCAPSPAWAVHIIARSI